MRKTQSSPEEQVISPAERDREGSHLGTTVHMIIAGRGWADGGDSTLGDGGGRGWEAVACLGDLGWVHWPLRET